MNLRRSVAILGTLAVVGMLLYQRGAAAPTPRTAKTHRATAWRFAIAALDCVWPR